MNYKVDVPGNCKEYFQKSGYIPVRGTVNQEKYSGTLIPRKNDRHVLFINWDIRTRIHKSEFDEIEVCIEFDPESRELPVPEDVEMILSEDEKIFNAFRSLSASQRREIILFITGAKKAETRLKRIRKIEDYLSQRVSKQK